MENQMKPLKYIILIIFLLSALFLQRPGLYSKEIDETKAQKGEDFTVEVADEDDAEEGASKKDKESKKVIIVTADRLGKELTDIPLAASVVDNKYIEEKVMVSMADLLNETPGFSQVYEHHSPLILRGSATSRMLMLHNGNRLMGSMPQGFMGQNVNVYGIDRVEVIRGPGSVIYGSGANTGIVNIIDRDIFKEEGIGGSVSGSYGSNSNEGMALGSFHWNTGELFAMQLSGRYRKAENMHYGGGKEADNSFYEDKDAVMKLGFKVNEKNRLILESSAHFGGPWGKPAGFNKNEYMKARNENDTTCHGALFYEARKLGVVNTITASAYYNYETRDYFKKIYTTTGTLSQTTKVSYEDQYGGGRLLCSFDLPASNNLSIGVDGYVFRIWSPEETTSHITDSKSEKDGAQGAGTVDVGVFAQNKWDINKIFHLVAGVRYDYAHVTEGEKDGSDGRNEDRHAPSGNIGFIVNPTDWSSITLNIGRTFRMPDAIDMFTERTTCAGTVAANPDLDPEYSWNFDIGYRGYWKDLQWDLALFANYYSDLIVKVADGSAYKMMNKEKARIIGGEASLSYKIRDIIIKGMHLKPGIVFTAYRGDDFTSSGNQWEIWESGKVLNGIPPMHLKSYIRYSYAGEIWNYFLEFEVDYSFKKYRVPGTVSEAAWSNEDTDAYTLLNIKTGVTIFKAWQGLEEIKLNCAIKNLLDTRYHPYGSYIWGKGRDIKVFLSFNFQ